MRVLRARHDAAGDGVSRGFGRRGSGGGGGQEGVPGHGWRQTERAGTGDGRQGHGRVDRETDSGLGDGGVDDVETSMMLMVHHLVGDVGGGGGGLVM